MRWTDRKGQKPSEEIKKCLEVYLWNSIKDMQSGKTSGPDGYPVEFYEKFSLQLTPLLLNMYKHSLEQASLPQSLMEALITVLLKPGKDPVDCSSYRPFSLLSVDVKILAKIVAS